MNITDQLARALRALRTQHATHYYSCRWGSADDDSQEEADRVLYAYDSQQGADRDSEQGDTE